MRIATVRTINGTRAVRVDDDTFVELPYPDVGALLHSGVTNRQLARAAGRAHTPHFRYFAPPVIQPNKFICVGVNYPSHGREMRLKPSRFPTLFAKFSGSLIGAADDIVLPQSSQQGDWEAELAVVVGRRIRHASESDAAAAIGGYTIVNDISMRDFQFRTPQYLQGKTFERSTPVGPWIVTPDELDTAGGVTIQCWVNDELMQSSSTSEMVRTPAALLAYVSEIITLEPGDIVSTGSPSGAGHGRSPAIYLRPGDVVRTRISGIGEMVNRCILDNAAPAPSQRNIVHNECS